MDKKHVMKRIIGLSFLLIVMSHIVIAQGPARERIETMKVGFITKKLQLTTEEAQRFWPVYNKFSDEMEKLKKNAKTTLIDELGSPAAMSDQEADKALQEMLQFKQNEAELMKKYVVEFKKVLPVQKVVMLFKAELDFKKELLRQLRDKRN